MSPWSVVEHTADVGLRATGPTIEAALAELVAGFGHLLCPDGEIAAKDTRVLTIDGADLDALVIDLLDDLNFLVQTDGFLPREATIELSGTRQRLTATVQGEDYDEERHGYMMEIKATTYHGLVVEEAPAVVEVLFDI